MPHRLTTERLALFGTLLATFGELHPLCDHWVNAAKAVSTFPCVSVRDRSGTPSRARWRSGCLGFLASTPRAWMHP